ncbi:bifunctional YncE family protein/alkaline phosphatase family protein [Desulfotomaculum copahuensis]|uniref:Phosphoesterase n=1 Tax=Desulfotomaculum copahuensis TaxID=1838280 RepID=A0A1B7LFA8_9FIRM|nr:bifunctional YncE family protein/alkaline phosphatase family protein [Desulfotomaculum copahuensis]OAT82341.1 hypothetical protein A6M21_09350 [Desulfotomaculum copahuensis]
MKKQWFKRSVASLALLFIVGSATPAIAGDNPYQTIIERPANGWAITPAGEQVKLGDRPYGMAISPDGKTILVSNDGQSTQSLMVVDRATGKVVQSIEYKKPEALYIGVVFSPDGKKAYASAGNNNKIRIYDVQGQQLTESGSIVFPATDDQGKKVNYFPAGLTISPDGQTLYVANNLNDSMSIINVKERKVIKTVPVGHNPYTVTLAKDGKMAYVSNWGGNTLSVVNATYGTAAGTITVGTHPSAMAINPGRSELYVANSDSDTISIIDTATNQVIRTIDLSPYPGAQEGSSPNALAVSPDGNTLYVANAGNNDIVVIRLAKVMHVHGKAWGNAQDKIEGMIPTAWYPTGIEISPDGKQLYVTNAKGHGAGPNPNGPNPYSKTPTPPDQYTGSMITGTLSIINTPDAGKLARYTRQVVENNGFNEQEKVRLEGAQKERVIPRRVGDPSPIKHVIYVVKENRTYDQVFGSLGKGNGDPGLNLFGDGSAPNQRQLARQFVTLDNFYADAEVSADGWNWITAAMANTYVQKNWPTNYGGRGRSYDFEGGNLATAPAKDPRDAYFWDSLGRAHVDYRNYGFFTSAKGETASTEPGLAAHTDHNYPGYDLKIKDQTRIQEWLKEFHNYEESGKLPAVELVRLPNDHTSGTKPGMPTPKAMVADNDYALGQLVEAVSKSRYWKDTAIFVTEDDAQNGPDHVDAHRTIALVISPYTQTGKVDSTFYTTTSMLRTMELIVGVPPMTQFDASATPMINAFTDKPDFTPYTAIVPKQPLDEINGANAPLAAESAKMNLAVEDRAPEQLLNEAIWKSVKGAGSNLPTIKTQFRENNLDSDD